MATVPSAERRSQEPFYIESDGKPMGETPRHIRNILYIAEPLREWYADVPDVYIGANMFVHYEEGNRNRHVSPDLFIVKGVPREREPERRSYRVWEEVNKGLDAVIEVTSKSTRKEDLEVKLPLYRDVLRVKEYFLFDPYREYLDPPLHGFRLARKLYRPIKLVANRMPSQVLGLHLEAVGELLRLYDPVKKRWLPIPPEERAGRRRAEAKARREAEARRQAEAEIERLRQQLEALRRQLPGQQ
jgi:Uma2 family endonuclease